MYYKLTFCVRNHLSCSSSQDSISKIYIYIFFSPLHPPSSFPALFVPVLVFCTLMKADTEMPAPSNSLNQANEYRFFSPSFTVSCVYFVAVLQQAVSHLHGLSAVDWANESVCASLYCGGGGLWGTETVCSHIWASKPQRPSDECSSLQLSLFFFLFFLSSPQNSKSWQQWQACYWKPGELGEERWITEQSFLTTREMKWRTGFGGIGEKKKEKESSFQWWMPH